MNHEEMDTFCLFAEDWLWLSTQHDQEDLILEKYSPLFALPAVSEFMV